MSGRQVARTTARQAAAWLHEQSGAGPREESWHGDGRRQSPALREPAAWNAARRAPTARRAACTAAEPSAIRRTRDHREVADHEHKHRHRSARARPVEPPAAADRRRRRSPSSSAIALDTKVVAHRLRARTSPRPASRPRRSAPRVSRRSRRASSSRAVDAATLAAGGRRRQGRRRHASTASPAGVGAVIPVSFTGVVGEGKSGIYNVAVDGLAGETQDPDADRPGDQRHRPARRHRRDQVRRLQEPDRVPERRRGHQQRDEGGRCWPASTPRALPGKTVSVVGAFTLVNPKNWLVTPVEIAVQ